MQTADISAFGNKMGQLEVCHLEERPAADEGPFVREEKHLIDILARELGSFVERSQALAELEHKNRELEQVMYVVSHDLRSPLVNVQGFCKELEAAAEELTSAMQGLQIPGEERENLAYLLEEDIPESLQFIVASAERMDVLLKGLLEVSRAGRAALSIEALEMNHLVSVVIDALEYQIQETGARVEVEDLPSCHGDAAQIGQVFANLVGNALQYLDPDRPGVVKIRGTREKGESVYCVQDNGTGIDIEHREKVFEIYNRLHPERGAGEGLGLTIVQKIAARHSGRVWLESEVGEGSRFFVALPSGTLSHFTARRAMRRKRK
jgi:signal transduction histidine kinase